MSSTRGNWSITSIARDRARWDAVYGDKAAVDDGIPDGMTSEEAQRLGLCSPPIIGNWDDYEPNTWSGG